MNINKIWKESAWIFVLAIILFVYYFLNLKNIEIIWELPDESGYLYNAAYLAGKDWSCYASAGKAYYGFGYSLILIPLFFVCNTGIGLIKGAILINYIIVVLTFFLQIDVLLKLFPRVNVYKIAFVAFMTSLFPYTVVSANKVLCECFLSLHVWIILLLFYKLITSNGKIIYLILGFGCTFIYYIHTRAIVVTVVVCVCVFVYAICIRNKKGLVLFGIMVVGTYLLGDLIKNNIISSLYAGENDLIINVSNELNFNFIRERIMWLLDIDNLEVYIVTAFCRAFYIVTASALTVLWSIKYLYSETVGVIKECRSWKAKNWTLALLGCIFIAMYLACCLSGAGLRSDFTYAFYGRYIEYVLAPLVGVGILYALNSDNKKSIYFFLIILFLGLAASLEINYLDNSSVRVDTARIAGFSFWISRQQTYKEFIYSQTLILIIALLFIVVISEKYRFKQSILIWVILFFLMNNRECINTINNVQKGRSEEKEIAEHINQNATEGKNIYFINGEYSYKWNYMRMQALLMDLTMVVLEDDEYENHMHDNAYIISYSDTKVSESLLEKNDLLLKGKTYSLYETR